MCATCNVEYFSTVTAVYRMHCRQPAGYIANDHPTKVALLLGETVSGNG
jgi:hypothetical protein